MTVSNNRSRTQSNEGERDKALRSAISFSRVCLLSNLLYFLWRVYTILRCAPNATRTDLLSFIAFLVVEWTFAVTGLFNALLLLGLGKKWSPQERKSLSGDDVPLVDVFLPCYGESIDIIVDTVVACIHLNYPKHRYRVIVLDDGNSSETKAAISDLRKQNPSSRLHYATRAAQIKIHSKAANINFGLDFVKSLDCGASEYFGVLDIDMIPTAEWLRATIPFLSEDKQVALAGSPQKFYNLPKGFTLASRYHLETDVMQRLFDSKGGALCMGSGYLAKRKIIENIGGFPAMVKQEDTFIVSIILQAHGYRTRLLEEEHQHGLYALTYTDVSRAHSKWMTGIIHAYSLFLHPIMADIPLAKRISGVYPILHLTLLRLFMMVSLPTILSVAPRPIIPVSALTSTSLFAFIAYSASYVLTWYLSIAADGTISIDDGQRLWHLPYQFKGLLWLIKHATLGESNMPRFRSTGADVVDVRKTAPRGFLARLCHTILQDGAWMHAVYLACLLFAIYASLRNASTMPGNTFQNLALSAAFPPFTRILCECATQATIPIRYLLEPDPNAIQREELIERDEKTGVARPTAAAIAPPQPPFWGALCSNAMIWGWFALVPCALAFVGTE